MTTPSRLLSAELLEKWVIDHKLSQYDDVAEDYYYVVDAGDLLEAAQSGRLSPTHGGDGVTTETNCPTCGSAVKVGGDGETHYYIPITRPAQPEGWIAVTERLPEYGGKYLCFLNNKQTHLLTFVGNYFACGIDTITNVTHWMPLPTPPAKGEDTTQCGEGRTV